LVCARGHRADLNVYLPWAEPMSRFTVVFERLAIDVLKECGVEGATESVNRQLPNIYAFWMDGRLIQALVGTRWGFGCLVKRSGCAWAAASKVAWRRSTISL
jgi:hypothetical protein